MSDIKNLLKQYNSLIEEIKDLERNIKKTQDYKVKVEKDKVTGSNPYFPYNFQNFNIEGYNYPEADKKEGRLFKLNELLIKRKCKCEDMKLEIEEFINNISDSRTRRIFQQKYIDNLEWLPIAMRMGKVHESYPRKIHDRYLEGLEGVE